MVEQLTVNQLVIGSSPIRGAKIKNSEGFLLFFVKRWLVNIINTQKRRHRG
jgi:hypothetical protein